LLIPTPSLIAYDPPECHKDTGEIQPWKTVC